MIRHFFTEDPGRKQCWDLDSVTRWHADAPLSVSPAAGLDLQPAPRPYKRRIGPSGQQVRRASYAVHLAPTPYVPKPTPHLVPSPTHAIFLTVAASLGCKSRLRFIAITHPFACSSNCEAAPEDCNSSSESRRSAPHPHANGWGTGRAEPPSGCFLASEGAQRR